MPKFAAIAIVLSILASTTDAAEYARLQQQIQQAANATASRSTSTNPSRMFIGGNSMWMPGIKVENVITPGDCKRTASMPTSVDPNATLDDKVIEAKTNRICALQKENPFVALTKDYPVAVSTEHFKVERAGFMIHYMRPPVSLEDQTNMISSILYLFRVTIKKPFDRVLYTETTFDDPADANHPSVAKGIINMYAKAFGINHGPLHNVTLGHKYRIKFAVYSDPERHELVEEMNQDIIASAVNNNAASNSQVTDTQVDLHPAKAN